MSRLRSLLWCSALLTGLCAASQFGNLPLAFEPNQGQTDPRVRYLARSGNMVVFLTGDGYTLSTGGQSVSMRISGAARDPRVTPERPVEGVSNYYVAGRSITGIPHFERVRAQRIRPGIDAIFYGRERQVEYDFILDPGADPRSITLRFTGAGRPAIDDKGDLVLRSGEIEFRHHKPVASQAGSPVECAYAVLPNGDVRFKLGNYDKRQLLTIDPVLSYSTYLGGTSNDTPTSIAVDSSGAAYIAGYTTSTDFPVTSGSYRGSTDAFVTKLNPSGTALLYSTYIGGSYEDTATGIAVDSSGNAYVTGRTYSSDFMTSYKAKYYDAFVVKLGPAGTLAYALLVGGTGDDGANAIAIDAVGAAYITGYTNSSGLATLGAASGTFRGGRDAFVAKVSQSGSLLYFTYLGGTNDDAGNAIAVDPSGNAYVTGLTSSNDFPVTSDALDATLGVTPDAFVSVLSFDGTRRTYSSYLGGGGSDEGKAIALDSAGSVYVTGNTSSVDFPTTPGSFATSKPYPYSYYTCAFVAKFSRSPSWALSYSTYIGAADSNTTYANGIAVDAAGQAVVVGNTYQYSFPTTPGALKRVKNGSYESDLFLIQLNASGNSMVYSTLLGGTNNETAGGVALDANGAAYLTGATVSAYYPTTPGAFQQTNPRGTNTSTYIDPGVVSKIDLMSPTSCIPQITPASASVAARGGTATFQLTLAAGCPWEAVPQSGLTLSGAQVGMGSASPITITVTATANDSTYSSRTSTVTIGEASFAVTQPAWACNDPVFNPASLSFDGAGGIRSIAVSMPSSCSWTASANSPWLSVTSGATGSGSRTVTVYAAQNSFATRSTSIAIGGQSIPITQTGGSCTATASATPAAFAGGGGSGSVQITTASTCRWTAYSSTPWIQVNPALSAGQGSGSAPFTIAQNPGAVARTGALLIGDQTVTITQAAGPFGVPTSYTMSVFAGGGSSSGPLGDGGPATSAYIYYPRGLAFNGSTLYIADRNYRIRAVTADGLINTVAGGGTSTADGVAPTTAQLGSPEGLAFDRSTGYLYFSEGCRVRRIFGAPNVVTTVAGSTTCGFSGDDGPAASAKLGTITGLAVDSSGSVYIADSSNNRVRKIAAGIITTVAGGGSSFADGVSPTVTNLNPCGVAVDSADALYIADCSNNRIRKVANGVITTIAGGGQASGDGLPATSSYIYPGGGIGVDGMGAVYFGDSYRLRKVGVDGLISTVSSSSQSISPRGIVFDAAANVFVADSYNSSGYVWKLTPTPTFCTYSAGTVASQPSAGGVLSVSVTAGPGCTWQASLSGVASWITLNTTQGSGNGTASVTVAANTGLARTATVIVAGQAVTIQQAGVSKTRSDFNADGVPDLVWQNETSKQVTVSYYGGAGGATYQGGNLLYPSGAYGWRVAAVADFNKDGVPDLVWQNELTGQASVHYYGGAGGATDVGWNWLYPGSNFAWKIVAAADFNGDGTPDLVWQNEATRQVTVHYYGGAGGAVDQGFAWLYGASAPGWRVVAAADFNSDGVPDLVWQSDTTRQVSVHYYGGSGGAVDQGWRWLNGSGAPGWKVKVAADFNGDGVADLVWMNDTTRQVTVHYYGGLDGSVYQGWNWLSATGAPGSTLVP